MTAIFKPQGPLFRATEDAGGPWSPDLLQGSATIGLMTREVERLALASDFAVRRLTFDLWRPAGLRAFAVTTDMLRDGRKAKTMQVRLMDGETEISRLHRFADEAGRIPFRSVCKGRRRRRRAGDRHAAAGPCAKMEPLFSDVSVRLIEGALEKPGPAAAWMRRMRLWSKVNPIRRYFRRCRRLTSQAVSAQIVDMRQWSFVNPEISLYFFRAPEGEWILVRSCTRVGANGAGLTTATLSDLKGPFAEVMQAMSFERREAV